ncbi:hypothetical protein K227x_54670 [Rubripirellula lacrimiformis]|uniref:Uncharacterized protein n=1 Tax=Rubripirellula lacrimiformis TaxID=1930273 RepID=A0A517NIT6_9BACT|nr:hypothetical protein K227x_54670 [Rubripirellula lacrimiformis]
MAGIDALPRSIASKTPVSSRTLHRSPGLASERHLRCGVFSRQYLNSHDPSPAVDIGSHFLSLAKLNPHVHVGSLANTRVSSCFGIRPKNT